jgi:hypothetical protein
MNFLNRTNEASNAGNVNATEKQDAWARREGYQNYEQMKAFILRREANRNREVQTIAGAGAAPQPKRAAPAAPQGNALQRLLNALSGGQ